MRLLMSIYVVRKRAGAPSYVFWENVFFLSCPCLRSSHVRLFVYLLVRFSFVCFVVCLFFTAFSLTAAVSRTAAVSIAASRLSVSPTAAAAECP